MYKGAIVSEDGTSAIIIFSLYDDADIQSMAKAVKEKTESLQTAGTYLLCRITNDDYIYLPSDFC